MLLAALLAALPVAPGLGAAGLCPHTGVHLLDSGAQVVLADDELPPIEGMTREQLQREWDRLDAERPGIGAPIGALAGGVGLAIVGLVVTIYGVTFAALSTDAMTNISPTIGVVLLVVGVAMLAAGVTVGVLGGLKLRANLHERSRYGDQMNRIRDLLDRSPGQPYLPTPGQTPPPPPSVQRLPPAPTVTLVSLEL